MNCVQCDTEMSKEELNMKSNCNKCSAQYCRMCSDVNSTEIRVLQLSGSRKLRFICKTCDDTNAQQNLSLDEKIQ